MKLYNTHSWIFLPSLHDYFKMHCNGVQDSNMLH